MNQLNKVFLVDKVRKSYSNEKNVKYKHVFRIRFDILPLNQIDYSKLDQSVVYIPPKFIGQDSVYNDIVAVGNENLMNVYSERVLYYDEVIKRLFIPNKNIAIHISFFLEKFYTKFINFVFKKKRGTRKGLLFYHNFMLLRNLLFITPPRDFRYTSERHLFEYLKLKKIKVENLNLDCMIVRGNSSECILSMNKSIV